MAQADIIIDGEEFTCNSKVDAQYVGNMPYGYAYGDLKVYCPTLMPMISMGLAKLLPAVTINKSIFINSSECPITPMSKVVPQNFFTAKSYFHTEFQRPHIDYGSTITVKGNDHDFQSVNITTDTDPTTFYDE